MSAVLEQIAHGDTESPFPPPEQRPAYVVLDDWREHGGRRFRPGVYYCGMTTAKKDAPSIPVDAWFCSPLHVDAVTFDDQDNNFGRLLRFRNTLGRWREWAMPMELLSGRGEVLRGELLAMGAELDPHKAANYLPAYLQHRPPKRRIRCAVQVGWCRDSFVLPDKVIGPGAADVIFQSGERSHDEFTTGGDLDTWRAELASLAPGNPLLLFALSAAFAGPLLSRCHIEGGGVHFVGDSSTGKTTLIEAACSVWGGPNYKRSWRGTANGMEGAAAMFNDCLLALDEISECDPREVGAIVYALGNGRGKQRASRSGAARLVTRWRCFILSSGERTISTTMHEGGKRAKAGQFVRMLDIPATRAFGAWDELCGKETGAAFSDAIKRAAASSYGLAGRSFLESLTNDGRDLSAYLEQFKAGPLFATDGEGQVKRAAARFALIGLAGELATEYRITGWAEGGAADAAAECFRVWQATRTKGNDEQRQMLEAVSDFIDRHGDSRFSCVTADDQSMVRDRAGYWEATPTGRVYLFTSAGMREALTGFDLKRGLDVLQLAGALPEPGASGRRDKAYRVAGRVVKLYRVDPANVTGGSHGA